MLRVFIVSVLASLMAVALTGCGGGGGGTATVVGRVVDDGTLAGIANAIVRVGNRAEARTGADGRFTVNNAPVGDQMLVITAGGHDTLHLPVTLTDGQNNVGLCYMAPTLNPGRGAITGRLALANGTPVSGGIVQSGTASAVSRSDGTGRFTLYNVPAGSPQVSFYDANSGASAWRFIAVNPGETVDIGRVILSFGPPPPPL